MRFEFPRPPLPEQVTFLRPAPVRAWLARLAQETAVHDWLVLAFNVLLLVAALIGRGPAHDLCVARTSMALAVVAFTLVLVRGGLMKPGPLAGLLHRLAVYGSVQLSYFILRDLLPTVNTRVLDEQLFRLDERLFGVEPTLWLDQYVTPSSTEWFSFFYFSYFFVLGVHVLPFLFGTRKMALLSEFALGLLGVFCVGQLLYMVVPGFGPHRHLAGLYQHQLPSGFWYDTVIHAVQAGGAQMDIFPSLHTGGPSFIAMFSFRHRDKLPFKYTWPVFAFFALNIIGATLFLRWHYLVDVIAGLALAASWAWGAGWISAWEQARRARLGVKTGIWWTLWGEPSDEPGRPLAKPAAE